MNPEQIAQVRRFNRLVTQRAGALDDHFLGRDRPLGASRVLFEIGPNGADVRELRARLGLDSGYLSRLVQSLVTEGLVTLDPAPEDERVRHATLTEAGLNEFAEMNRRSDLAAEATLAGLPPHERQRLVDAMAQVCGLLRAANLRIERADPSSREVRWCLQQYFEELSRRFEEGFDPDRVLPTDDNDLRPPHGAVMIATIDGDLVACASLKTIAPGVGYLKRMWVDGRMRGLGVGRRLLAAMEAEARKLGMSTLRLETNRALTEAIRMYDRSGFARIPAFNAEPYAHHWFEKRLGDLDNAAEKEGN
ncbi:MAG: bifunctional helix-turn-helix transcriptional regulator/GNAT family N-acetyltransferase [Gemmatimonadales bacterium]